MRVGALPVFISMTKDLEGADLTHMYVDTHKDSAGNLDPLVTTGSGNLADPIEIALEMEWRKPDGSLASHEEIAADWNAIKQWGRDNPELVLRGGNTSAQKAITTLRLDRTALDRIFNARLQQNETLIRPLAPQYDQWPASAQIGINSMAWAMGVGNVATFHKFLAACNVFDFDTAAKEAHISNANANRNTDDHELFAEAAEVMRRGLNFELVFFPNTVASGILNAGQTIATAALTSPGIATGIGLGTVAIATTLGLLIAKYWPWK